MIYLKTISWTKNFNWLFILIIISFYSFSLVGQTNPNHIWVDGYVRTDGTYVRGHWKTSANQTINDNFTTKGNVNPYTGKKGWIERESVWMYDSRYKRRIPRSYIFSSKDVFRKEIVRVLNHFSNQFEKMSEAAKDYSFFSWKLKSSRLIAKSKIDVWGLYERDFTINCLNFYFEALKYATKIEDWKKLLWDAEIYKIEVTTAKSKYVIDIREIMKKEGF